MSTANRIARIAAANQVFTPTAPIDDAALFAGRSEQTVKVIGAITQKGQHAVLFGERGVGKTSLAKIIGSMLRGMGRQDVVTAHVNVFGSDSYEAVWTNIFEDIPVESSEAPISITGTRPAVSVTTLASLLPNPPAVADIRRVLSAFCRSSRVIIILDEFDRASREVKSQFADMIKWLSDATMQATLLIVGVADTIDELIAEHLSIERALKQIHMPRMSESELAEIVDKGLAKLQMTIEASARTALTSLSRGLPHYTHALALHAAVVAIEADQPLISRVHVTTAIKRALEDAHQSTKSAYTKAVSSSHRESLYAQVLLACSLAHCDPMGYFAPADVRDPMTKIMGEPYDIENFNQHLAAFCEDARGSVLHRIGGERRYRYRFSNPLMQPYVMLRGIQVGMLKAEDWGL